MSAAISSGDKVHFGSRCSVILGSTSKCSSGPSCAANPFCAESPGPSALFKLLDANDVEKVPENPLRRARSEIDPVSSRLGSSWNPPKRPVERSLRMVEWLWLGVRAGKSPELGEGGSCCASDKGHSVWMLANFCQGPDEADHDGPVTFLRLGLMVRSACVV
jgi:hypothetical protein